MEYRILDTYFIFNIYLGDVLSQLQNFKIKINIGTLLQKMRINNNTIVLYIINIFIGLLFAIKNIFSRSFKNGNKNAIIYYSILGKKTLFLNKVQRKTNYFS